MTLWAARSTSRSPTRASRSATSARAGCRSSPRRFCRRPVRARRARDGAGRAPSARARRRVAARMAVHRGPLHARAPYSAAGDHRSAVEELTAAGAAAEAWGVRNPAAMPWRSSAAVSFAALGEHEQARALAGEELARARRWGAGRAIGVALRAAGLAQPGTQGIALLDEAARRWTGAGAAGTRTGTHRPGSAAAARRPADRGARPARPGPRSRPPLRRDRARPARARGARAGRRQTASGRVARARRCSPPASCGWRNWRRPARRTARSPRRCS